MKSSLLFTAFLALISGAHSTDWVQYENSLYTAGSGNVTWSDARAACRKLHPRADLITIHSYGELDFVAGMFGEDIWIGFNDIETEDRYVWANGATVDFTVWAERVDNTAKNCVHMDSGYSGAWVEDYCSNSLTFACKIEL
ncbi:lectin BRA-3-like [Amphibalanus amphitrite]|uniref:lectin BRA-3-like n=1 Tax=Amphibalanus amphitrite TaxID=1232801 RepID=UPI001C9263CC|nr:lectin BRA-3-like [Amphibalanus amphitrite]